MALRRFLRTAIVAFLVLAAGIPKIVYADSFKVIGSNVYYVDDNGQMTNQGAASSVGNGKYTGGSGTTQYTWDTKTVGDTTYVTKITNNKTGEVNTIGYDRDYNIVSNASSTDSSQATQGTVMGDIKSAYNAVTSGAQKTYTAVTDPQKFLVDQVLAKADSIFDKLAEWILTFANFVLYVAGKALNAAFSALVTNMGSAEYKPIWDAVKLGWKAIRDVGNTLFIFVLLYAAFNTVLGRKDGLDLVPRIIAVALLVNFSFLFASSVIDVSNQLAQQVYESLIGGISNGDISGQLATLSNYGLLQSASKGTLTGFNGFVRACFVALFLIILSGFLLAIVFTLIARFVTLIVLCFTSALAFLAYLLPRFENQSKEWWSALIGQSFYAPAVFLMILITTGIADKFNSVSLSSGSDTRFQNILAFGLSEFFKFCILIGLLYASIVLAKKLSEQGSKAAISIGQRAQKAVAGAAFGTGGFALRGTLGRLGQAASDNDWLKKQSVKAGVWGAFNRRIVGVAGRAQDSSFDFRKTGVAAAMAASTGADYGHVSDKASKGWKGIADAREKKVQDRIDAVKKWDVATGDKEKYMKDLAAEERRLSGNQTPTSDMGRAQDSYEVADRAFKTAERDLATARRGNNQQAIAAAQQTYDQAKQARQDMDKNRFTLYNKKFFGVSSDSRTVNYSNRYAQSLRDNANSRVAVVTKNVGAVAGMGTLAMFAPHAAIAAGVLAGGRVIHGTIRGIRDRNKQFTDSKRGDVRQGFWRGLARNQAVHEAAGTALEKERKAQGWRDKIDEIDALERTRSLTDAEKTERRQNQQKLEKYENAGKKKDE